MYELEASYSLCFIEHEKKKKIIRLVVRIGPYIRQNDTIKCMKWLSQAMQKNHWELIRMYLFYKKKCSIESFNEI